MNIKEIIENFWSLPGMVGVAIIYSEAKPYFYVKKQILDWEKPALLQMILGSVAKANQQKIDDFEAPVMGYYTYNYKLKPELILVVLTQTNLVKLPTINYLRSVLQVDFQQSITIFENVVTQAINSPVFAKERNVAFSPQNNISVKPNSELVTIEELLNAINHVSKFTSNYVGSKLTANYLEISRPDHEWLNNFEINGSAKIIFPGIITETVTASQHLLLKEWINNFIKRSSQIIQDLPAMIEQKCLNDREKRLLLSLAVH